jgi:hypothetical protein
MILRQSVKEARAYKEGERGDSRVRKHGILEGEEGMIFYNFPIFQFTH